MLISPLNKVLYNSLLIFVFHSEKNRAYELNVYSDVVTLTIPNVKRLYSDSAIEITFKNITHVCISQSIESRVISNIRW